MVTTIEVEYPKGWIPTLVSTAPAKSISIHELRKKSGPADSNLTNALMPKLLA